MGQFDDTNYVDGIQVWREDHIRDIWGRAIRNIHKHGKCRCTNICIYVCPRWLRVVSQPRRHGNVVMSTMKITLSLQNGYSGLSRQLQCPLWKLRFHCKMDILDFQDNCKVQKVSYKTLIWKYKQQDRSHLFRPLYVNILIVNCKKHYWNKEMPSNNLICVCSGIWDTNLMGREVITLKREAIRFILDWKPIHYSTMVVLPTMGGIL